ncbi:hypothetical protein BDE02_19G095800 [Populus trichocarpa]|nr:hypothetical protein BDE02_19G095800 [Populus trichocarpa]
MTNTLSIFFPCTGTCGFNAIFSFKICGPMCTMNAEQFSCDPGSQAICVLHEILGEPRFFRARFFYGV